MNNVVSKVFSKVGRSEKSISPTAKHDKNSADEFQIQKADEFQQPQYTPVSARPELMFGPLDDNPTKPCDKHVWSYRKKPSLLLCCSTNQILKTSYSLVNRFPYFQQFFPAKTVLKTFTEPYWNQTRPQNSFFSFFLVRRRDSKEPWAMNSHAPPWRRHGSDP